MTGYTFAYDPELWIAVPLDFGPTEWADAEAWADDVSRQISAGAPDPESVRPAFYETALEVAALDTPGAADRFWYFPVDARFVSVVNGYAVPRDVIEGEATLEQFAGSDDESITVPSIESFDSAVFGRLVLGLTTTAFQDDDDQRVVVGQARLVGETAGHIFLFEVLDRELGRIALMLEDMTALLESVRFSAHEG